MEQNGIETALGARDIVRALMGFTESKPRLM